ncbi:MAG: TIGR01212 family radical SAM protein [Bacteroidales bacterium]|nr:TIGR01212 family radical SAM protein [Bacteroidales bacterium]
MSNALQWNDYSSYIRRTFGERVQKISVNAGFTCPNRDGKISTDGCIYCTNKSFSPFYCNSDDSIAVQLQKGIDFFRPKYSAQKYLAYFQSYTNTYVPDRSEKSSLRLRSGDGLELLRQKFDEALSVDGVIGLVVSTRPDCIDDEILRLLADYAASNYVEIEYGLESTKNSTLEFINRGHTYEQAVEAVELTQKYGIMCGLHLIIGLPYETEDDFYAHAEKISHLPISTLKLHQMQVLRTTRLEKLYAENPNMLTDLSLENYVRIVANFMDILNPEIIVERLTSESPRDMLLYPDWGGRKNFEVAHIVDAYMKRNGMYQGRNFKG